ncbi:MAG: ferritin family protein [Candidatus Krumholzibacteriota bacterium]|nr:ferritin family protein [Candidatus Krumholzibacteriota bacterium]
MSDENKDLKSALAGAIYREIGASGFYRFLGESITNPEGSKIFLKLAEDESSHRMKLEAWYKKTFGEEFVPSQEKIRESEGTRIEVSEVAGALKALDIAIEAESRARDFYENEAGKASEEELKTLFLTLAEEERGHYNLLQGEKSALIDAFYWFDMDSTKFMED